MITEVLQVYLPNFQGTAWAQFISDDLVPVFADLSGAENVDQFFESLANLASPSVLEALNITMSTSQRLTLQDQIKLMPCKSPSAIQYSKILDTLGYHFIVRVFCLTDRHNLCLSQDYMSYLLNEVDHQFRVLNAWPLIINYFSIFDEPLSIPEIAQTLD